MTSMDWARIKRKLQRVARKSITARCLTEQFSEMGILSEGILFVHTSLSSLGNVRGGAEALIASLRSIKIDGTLAMPAHSWKEVNSGCREFSVCRTPSCVGLTCEVFRLQDDTYRSLHPTHSISAVGSDATWLTQKHEEADSPCGKGTPYEKLIRRSAKIMFIGTDLGSNTLFHTVETLENLPYSLNHKKEQFYIQDAKGNRFNHYFRLHNQGIKRRFSETEGYLVNKGIAKVFFLRKTKIITIDAVPFAEVMSDILSRCPDYLLAS